MEDLTKYAQTKQRLYAMKNGVLADQLRQAGCPYRLIWGLNLPQLTEIAAETGSDAELAEQLWANRDLRESQLLAPMLYPVAELTREKALELVGNLRWQEDADILCFKLLRKADFALQLATELIEDEDRLKRYTALRLYFNLVAQAPAEAIKAAEKELTRNQPLSNLASMLREEANFILGN